MSCLFVSFYLKSGVKEVVSTKKPVLHIFRALAGAASNILYFYCYQRMSIADVTIIGQAVPIFVVFLQHFFTGKSWLEKMVSYSFGFLGVVLVINPAGNIQIESFIALLATLYLQVHFYL